MTDVAELIKQLGGGQPVHLVGQDWGAIISYAVLAAFSKPIRRAVVMAVPTLALCGSDDLRGEQMTNQAQYFSGEYSYQVVPGTGHFLHREQPKAVMRHFLDWLGTSSSTS